MNCVKSTFSGNFVIHIPKFSSLFIQWLAHLSVETSVVCCGHGTLHAYLMQQRLLIYDIIYIYMFYVAAIWICSMRTLKMSSILSWLKWKKSYVWLIWWKNLVTVVLWMSHNARICYLYSYRWLKLLLLEYLVLLSARILNLIDTRIPTRHIVQLSVAAACQICHT